MISRSGEPPFRKSIFMNIDEVKMSHLKFDGMQRGLFPCKMILIHIMCKISHENDESLEEHHCVRWYEYLVFRTGLRTACWPEPRLEYLICNKNPPYDEKNMLKKLQQDHGLIKELFQNIH